MKMQIYYSGVRIALAGVVAGSMIFGGGFALAAQGAVMSPLEAKIARELKAIQAAETKGEPEARLGTMWGLVGSDYQDAIQFGKAETAYTKALHLLKSSPDGAANYATVLDNLGLLYMQLGRFDEAETLRRQSLKMRTESGQALAVAMSEGHIAEVELARHKFAAAAQDARTALAGLAAADDPDASDKLAVMVTLTYALCSQKRCDEGLHIAQDALAVATFGFQPNSLPMGQTLMALGYAQWKSGENEEAERSMREGVAVLRQCVAPGSPVMVGTLTEYRTFLKDTGRETEVAVLDREIDNSRGERPLTCVSCTVNALGLMRVKK